MLYNDRGTLIFLLILLTGATVQKRGFEVISSPKTPQTSALGVNLAQGTAGTRSLPSL
jgi:hypothetical protein